MGPTRTLNLALVLGLTYPKDVVIYLKSKILNISASYTLIQNGTNEFIKQGIFITGHIK